MRVQYLLDVHLLANCETNISINGRSVTPFEVYRRWMIF